MERGVIPRRSCTVNLLAVNSGRLLITLVPGDKKVYKKFINLKLGLLNR